MTRARKFCITLICSGLISSLVACKVSDDAIAASQQMTSTANALNDYYSALDARLAGTISLYELDGAISGIPFGDDDRKLSESTREELQKRKELADALARLASAMSTLSNSKAASDVQASATQLGNELIAVQALPGGSSVPDAVGKAGNFLLQIVQQHEEKKAARAIDETLKAVADLFEKEKPTYDSIARTHDREASQIAQDLLKSNAVDPSPMLAPALKPFDLRALPPSLSMQSSLKTLALSRLQHATDEAMKKDESASAAMLASLREMSSRVHLVATEKPMSLRGAPFSLKLVEDWAQSWSASLI
ncbi:lipoprotein [Terriglobus saanensis]|uniref:Putative lipoprotein n=1 Tax=Terriglobus saanensis (strain ATCC BAA-1853 / DSM 23119 / SP1PR4) TaxID=401053 RepID=E8V2K8_TERSS|nr:lipoprotein [Terriglobus saanensis]ADV82426.1 putative lipoprotein [Terriglobus saanensis SP1PR4]